MQERTPDEETTSRLALTALALAHAGARAQEILEAITTDCGNAGIALSHQQRGLIVTHALFSARNGKREGRRSPTTTPDAPPATPASDPPVVTSTTQARDSRDRSAGIPIVPDMPAVDEPPSGRTGTVQPLTNRRRPAHAPTEPFTPVPNRIYELAEEYRLSAAAQAVLHVFCRDIYGWHLQQSEQLPAPQGRNPSVGPAAGGPGPLAAPAGAVPVGQVRQTAGQMAIEIHGRGWELHFRPRAGIWHAYTRDRHGHVTHELHGTAIDLEDACDQALTQIATTC